MITDWRSRVPSAASIRLRSNGSRCSNTDEWVSAMIAAGERLPNRKTAGPRVQPRPIPAIRDQRVQMITRKLKQSDIKPLRIQHWYDLLLSQKRKKKEKRKKTPLRVRPECVAKPNRKSKMMVSKVNSPSHPLRMRST